MSDPIKIEFVNRTSENIILIWLKKEKERYLYVDIGPGKSARIITYISHTWVAVDKKFGRKLGFYERKNDEFKDDKTTLKFVHNNDFLYKVAHTSGHSFYHTIYIAQPIKTLEQLCLEYLVDCDKIMDNHTTFYKLPPLIQRNLTAFCKNSKYYLYNPL